MKHAQGASIDDPKLRGLIPRITEQIFETIVASPSTLEYLVKVSYMEIYMVRPSPRFNTGDAKAVTRNVYEIYLLVRAALEAFS